MTLNKAQGDPLKAHLATVPEYSTPRIQFYYSSLPPKKLSNPTGYSSAINWWRRTLVDLVEKGLLSDDKLVLSVNDELREKLRWDKVGRPSSLGVVIVRSCSPALPYEHH
jgi:charged multivesicular body protein 7